MLDKNVEYAPIYLRRPKSFPIREASLPSGLRYVNYKEGDESFWADIMVSVGEFSDIEAAKDYFEHTAPLDTSELSKRLFFVENEVGAKIATATSSFYMVGDKKTACIDSIAVKSEYQRGGIGKAVISRAIVMSRTFDGARDIYLTTSTQAHKSIELLQKLGFIVCSGEVPGIPYNDYAKAVEILHRLGHNIIAGF